jgi:alpha-D-ribose 1-methylphosphonate 5-triphosphate synthase subunit PhnL
MRPVLEASGLGKTFVLHPQGGLELTVLRDAALALAPGECVALDGPSGSGKSTLLKLLYANYRATAGAIRLQHRGHILDLVTASPREVLEVRRDTIGYVSQFLRAIPRVPAERIVAEALDGGAADPAALARARELLARLNLPARLWGLAPATFSGGEQQRVNIAHGLIKHRPVLLLDEPTASLDAANRAAVVALIGEARERGAAIAGIFHDRAVRDAVATRVVEVTAFR